MKVEDADQYSGAERDGHRDLDGKDDPRDEDVEISHARAPLNSRLIQPRQVTFVGSRVTISSLKVEQIA